VSVCLFRYSNYVLRVVTEMCWSTLNNLDCTLDDQNSLNTELIKMF